MNEILHSRFPPDIKEGQTLPGITPLGDLNWLSVDEAYAAQMAYRRQLLSEKRALVLQDQDPQAQEAIEELFHAALPVMSGQGFSLTPRRISCPDGYQADRETDTPLALLGACCQEDLCVLIKNGNEHVLAAAVLCFPASWTLSEKIGRPLTAIHNPVQEYDESVAKRVQRLFDGVRVGMPLRRNNYLRYNNPDLFQPLSEDDPQRQEPAAGQADYLRAERQVILRLPESNAVIFSIHSYVIRV